MEKEAARYFLRKRFANGQEEMEYMSMEDAYHTMPQIMTEELIARHKGKIPKAIPHNWQVKVSV